MRYKRLKNTRPKSKRPRNRQNLRHGYWEFYTGDGILWFCGAYVNGDRFGHHLRFGRGITDVSYNNYYAR